MAGFWQKRVLRPDLAPDHHWSLEQVWAYNGTSSEDIGRHTALYRAGKIRQALSGFPCHWAYAVGNTRLSCAMCVLASQNDILNGAKHNPWTWAELALMETMGGWGFQQSRWLASLSQDVLKLSFQQRDRLYRVLCELGLVQPCQPAFANNLLQCLPPDCLALWTQTAFLKIAQSISDYWAIAHE